MGVKNTLPFDLKDTKAALRSCIPLYAIEKGASTSASSIVFKVQINSDVQGRGLKHTMNDN